MLYILVLLGLIGAVIYLSLPKLSPAHAAQAKPLGPFVRPYKRYPFAAFVRDTSGKPITLKGRMIGTVFGRSCEKFGITDGAEFIADFLTDTEKLELKKGDVVVVDAVAAASETGKRLRIVESISGDLAHFMPDGYGRNRRSRPLTEVSAKVGLIEA